MARELLRGGADQLRFDQRLVALHVDDDRIGRITALRGDFRDAVGAGRMIGARHNRREAVGLDRRGDLRMVGSDDDFGRAAGARAFGDMHDHRAAGDVERAFFPAAASTRGARE